MAEGPLTGSSLRDLVRHRGEELFGPVLGRRAQFRLPVKLIDAHQDLSVQVHPDDERGRRLADDNGKTETWVVMHAEPGSVIYAGLRPGVTRGALAEALRTGAVEPLLHRFEARAGDCILIPAGIVHAIGAGVVLAEIRQMSDATFRLHDWGRVGADGKPRQLHLVEALESTDFSAGPVDPLTPEPESIAEGTRERLARCAYFALERLRLNGPVTVGQDDRFTILLGLGSSAEVRTRDEAVPLEYGQTLLLAAALGGCEVVPRGGEEAVVLTCVVP